MTTGATPILLGKKSQEAVIQYYKECATYCSQSWNLRSQMREIDLVYQREKDWTAENQRAKLANRYGDADKVQNITLPVVLPQVEAAVVYQSSVFLTGTPIFEAVSSPDVIDEALQLNAVLEQQQQQGSWPRHIMMAFRDGFKYNLFALECCWEKKMVAAFESDATFAGGKQAKPKELVYEGNAIRWHSLYNTFFDTRCLPTEIYCKGEFAGYTEFISRIQLKQEIAEMQDKMVENIIPAFESNTAAGGLMGGAVTDNGYGFYMPQINPDALVQAETWQGGMNWLSWADIAGGSGDRKIAYKNGYERTVLYARILPSDFGIRAPSANTPQVWKFIIINHQHIIYVERQTNAHGYIPMFFGQPNEDGLGYQTKSVAKNVQPLQSVGSALLNSVLAARRRAISDRGLYDPSRITEANINAANPSAKIPVKPNAYGKPLSEAYFPIPFRDENSGLILQEVGQLSGLANQISGQNPARQGQFVKGNKTLREYSDVMANANGRDQMCSILMEYQVFAPIKYVLKSNILQYQAGTEVYSQTNRQLVEVNPLALRKKILEMKVADGLTPVDKLINQDVLMVALQTIGTSPQINSAYNIAPLFSYLMKSQGGDLRPFEKSQEQLAYEQAMAAWQQLALQIVQAGGKADQIPPQPLPQNYGYDPAAQPGAPSAPSQAPQQQPTVVQNFQRNNTTQVAA